MGDKTMKQQKQKTLGLDILQSHFLLEHYRKNNLPLKGFDWSRLDSDTIDRLYQTHGDGPDGLDFTPLNESEKNELEADFEIFTGIPATKFTKRAESGMDLFSTFICETLSPVDIQDVLLKLEKNGKTELDSIKFLLELINSSETIDVDTKNKVTVKYTELIK